MFQCFDSKGFFSLTLIKRAIKKTRTRVHQDKPWYLLFDYLTCNVSNASSALAALQLLLLQVAFGFGHNVSARHIKMDTEQKPFLEIFPSTWWGLKGTPYETEQINFTPKFLSSENLCL